MRELVATLKGGLLAAHRNVDDLANKIVILLENKTFARELAMTGRKAAENERFSWETVAVRVEEVYRKARATSPQR